MKSYKWFVFSFLWVFPLLSSCSQEDGWTVYTAVNQIKDVAIHKNHLYAATDGGVAQWDNQTGEQIQTWTAADGLLNNQTEAIVFCQFPEDVLFVGTVSGLARFDLGPNEWSDFSTGLSVDVPIVALACSKHVLAVGFDDGDVAQFDRRTGRWQQFTGEMLGGSAINDLAYLEGTNSLWVAYQDVVLKIENGVGNLFGEGSALDDPTTSLSETAVRAINVDAQDNVWLGTLIGLTRVTSQGKITFFPASDQRDWPYFTRVDSIAIGENDTIWTNTAFGGVCQFSPASQACLAVYDDEIGMSSRFNTEIVVDNGRIYYGSLGGGLSVFDGESWSQWRSEGIPSVNWHRALLEDTDGMIWLGGAEGVYRFSPDASPTEWEDLSENIPASGINVFFEIEQGMWIGHSAGVSFLGADNGEWAHLSSGNFPGSGIAGGAVTAVSQDSNNHLWFGTTAGLTVWDGQNFTYVDFLTDEERINGRTPHAVNALLWDGDGMWVGTNRTLLHISSENGTIDYSQQVQEGDETVVVNDLVQTEDGLIYIAINQQLYRFEDELTLLYVAELPIRAINPIANNHVWLGLQNDQMIEWQDGNETIPQAPTPFNGRYLILTEDGVYWIVGGQGGGVVRFAGE